VALVAAVVAVALAIGVGVEHRYGERAQRAARLGLAIMLYGLVPFIVFFNLARLELTVDIGGGIALGWLTLAVVVFIAWQVGRGPLKLDRPATGSLALCALQANTGYLGLPLVALTFGTDQLAEAIAFDSLVQLPALLIAGFGIGAVFGSAAGQGFRQRFRAFLVRNPPLFAAIAGLLAPDALAPDVLLDASRIAIAALLPLGFFAVGVTLAAEAEEGTVRFPPPVTVPVVVAVGLRIVVPPIALFLLALPLIDLPPSYLVLAAMPVGVNALVVGHVYGLELKMIAAAITWSTVIVIVAGLLITGVLALT
jgi:predicted permease